MVRQQQPCRARQHRLRTGVEQLRRQRGVPQAAGHGGQHHQAHRHQGAQALKAGHQIDHHQDQKTLLPHPASSPAPSPGALARSARLQKSRVKGFKHQAPVHQRQGQQAHAAYPSHQQQAGCVYPQRAAKQDVQQVNLAAVARHQGHAQGQCKQVNGGQAGVFFQAGETAHPPCKGSHHQARQHAAQRHGRERQAGHHKADGHTGQNRVA